jgi:glyoxylase-like metal-dependent hydrolase (beta-lactamase superfamily II)
MFVYVIRGPGVPPILVDTGPRSIEEINKAIKDLVVEPVTQRPGEDILSIMQKAGIALEDVGYVFFTHMHYDHVTNVHLFPNAKIVASRVGFEEGCRRSATWIPGEVLFPMQNEWKDRVLLVHEDEVLPGIRTMWFGGHTPCSIGIAVNTSSGTAIITGDVVSKYANIEMDIPIGVYEDRQQVMSAMRRIREEADIIIPSHDPAVLERIPGGVLK